MMGKFIMCLNEILLSPFEGFTYIFCTVVLILSERVKKYVVGQTILRYKSDFEFDDMTK